LASSIISVLLSRADGDNKTAVAASAAGRQAAEEAEEEAPGDWAAAVLASMAVKFRN